MIIDAHTHLFPPDMIAGADAYRQRDAWFGEAFAASDIVFATPTTMLAEMDASGVDVAIVAGWPWQDQGLCRYHNRWLAATCADSGGRLRWMGILNPVASDTDLVIDECRALGAVGLGEINADAQGFDWRDKGLLRDAVEASVACDLPWMIHTSEPTGHRYPGKGTATPDRIVEFATAFPDLRVVAAHWGGGLPFYELMPEVRTALQNVAYDCAATTYLYRYDVFDAVARIVGPEKIIFGSDFPVLGMRRLVNRIGKLPFDQVAILGGNAASVYGIGGER